MKNKFVLNEDIREKTLLVIDDKGNKLGTMSKDEALELAKQKDLDLVLFSSGDLQRKIKNLKRIKFK